MYFMNICSFAYNNLEVGIIIIMLTSQVRKLKYKDIKLLAPDKWLVRTNLRLKPRPFGSRLAT